MRMQIKIFLNKMLEYVVLAFIVIAIACVFFCAHVFA